MRREDRQFIGGVVMWLLIIILTIVVLQAAFQWLFDTIYVHSILEATG